MTQNMDLDITQVTAKTLIEGEWQAQLPEFYALKGVIENNGWHDHQDAFAHSCRVVEAGEKLLNFDWVTGDRRQKLVEVFETRIFGGVRRADLLKGSLIWHDTAKKFTIRTGADGKTSCVAHEILASANVSDLANRCHFLPPETAWLARLVAFHGLINVILDFSLQPDPDPRIFGNFARKVGVQSLDLYVHMLADMQGSDLERVNLAEYQKRSNLLVQWIQAYDLTHPV